MSRYRGKVAVWDVVNEAIRDDWTMIPFWSRPPWRDTMWHRGIGDDYVDIAFRTAHAADPSAILVLNDYSVMEQNSKSDQMYAVAKGMLERGVPLHGVGLQGHLRFIGVDSCSLAKNMQRFADLGLDIYITELDVRLPDFVPDSIAFPQQARVYENVMKSCLEQPACVAVQTWGMTDRYSWVPGSFPGFGEALPLDKNLEAKPAYYALQAAMLSAPSSNAECGSSPWDWSSIVSFLLRAVASFFMPVHTVNLFFQALGQGN